MLLIEEFGMVAPAPVLDFDAERTRAEGRGPTTVREPARFGRGSVIAGKYRLETLLGEGGMAFVWRAYNLELELPVAIKLLRAGQKSERLAERLRFEARAAARLVHPSIVRVFDVAVADNGDPFIVMELLRGETLADRVGRGPISGTRAVQLMLPIAEALALAHASGIVHRDLKPDNVFLATDGEQLQPKLLDFGIAKLSQAPALTPKLTDKGTTLGSPNYMSPEQVRGDDVDYRSDIWSFCVVLYKAISGKAPFQAADKRATMDAILKDEPAPLPADLDKQLARLIYSGLAKAPEQRPSSIRELARQLAEWLLVRGVLEDAAGTSLATKWPAYVPERRPHLRWLLPMLVAVSSIGGGAAWKATANSRHPAIALARPVTPPQVKNLPRAATPLILATVYLPTPLATTSAPSPVAPPPRRVAKPQGSSPHPAQLPF